ERQRLTDPSDVLARLRALGDPDARVGMARYAIATPHAYGVSAPNLHRLARELGRDHALAGALWATEVHEARLLACLIDRPGEVTEAQLEAWVADFDSWDLCDGCCTYLFDRTPFAYAKAVEWSRRDEEFVKRAGFV